MNDNHHVSPPEVGAWLTGHTAALLGVPAEEITHATTFEELGLSSLATVVLAGDIEDRYAVVLPGDLLRTHPTIDAVAHRVAFLATGSCPEVQPITD